jgi:hypothetical protein
MEKIKNEDLKQIKGGFNFKIVFGIASIFTFVIGAVDGYLRPLKCNS